MAWKNYPGYRNLVAGMSGAKYGNRKIKSDGGVFDSVKEYRRWRELKLMEAAGEISDLKRQVRFILIPVQREPSTETYSRGKHKGLPKPGKIIEREVAYVADFVYMDSDKHVIVEDCKGMRTKDYVIKRKLMLHEYGIRILET